MLKALRRNYPDPDPDLPVYPGAPISQRRSSTKQQQQQHGGGGGGGGGLFYSILIYFGKSLYPGKTVSG